MKKIRKIVLISPTYTQPGLILKFLRFMPLGLAQIAALAPEYDYEIVDENIKKLDFQKNIRDADLVGLTAMTVQAPRAYKIADRLRAMGKTVVMGGSHVTALPKEAIEHADAIVIGEAEGIWPRLLRDFENGNLQKFYKNAEPPDLSRLPFARRDLLLGKYKYLFPNILQISRGCPFDCSFCSVTRFFGRKYRLRPIPEVIKEIKGMMENDKMSPWRKILSKFWKGATRTIFVFLDDNIFGQPNYARELFKALIPLKIFWGSQSSINIAKDEKTVELAAKSGCKYLFVGLESANQSALREVGKRQKPEFYEKAIKRLHKYGISIIAALIFGFDSDDKNVFKRTVEFARKIKSDLAQFTILTPLPGTRLREKLEKEGRIISSDWPKYNFGEVVFKPLNTSIEELEKGERWAWKKFYSMGSLLERLPLNDCLRLMLYLFTNFGFQVQVRRSLEYKKSRA